MRLMDNLSKILSFCSSVRKDVISVSIYPGAITFDVMFLDPISLAIDLLKPTKPAFDAA